MRNALDKLRALFAWIQGYISPVFVLLLCASFILWYIVKLEYTYNAKYDVSIDIDGERIRVPCYIEGQGSTLLGYRAYMRTQINRRARLRSRIASSIRNRCRARYRCV